MAAKDMRHSYAATCCSASFLLVIPESGHRFWGDGSEEAQLFVLSIVAQHHHAQRCRFPQTPLLN
eukprot:1160262-Pelagomonas_calceolata.AAC.8